MVRRRRKQGTNIVSGIFVLIIGSIAAFFEHIVNGVEVITFPLIVCALPILAAIIVS